MIPKDRPGGSLLLNPRPTADSSDFLRKEYSQGGDGEVEQSANPIDGKYFSVRHSIDGAKLLLQRIESRDYVDTAAILESGTSPARGLGAARTPFGHAFQPSECVKALVYFEGGDLESLSRPVKDTLIASVAAVDDLPHVPLLDHRLTLQ